MGDSQSMRVAESRNRVPDVVVITGMSGSAARAPTSSRTWATSA